MAKPRKKQEKTQKNVKNITDITLSLDLNSTIQKIILAVLLILSAVLPYYYIMFSLSVNGFLSFPLDDPWIHLQFAKNLAEFGSFSYYKNELVTAGSTSPIYTLLLALGFFITKNEMWLSYVLGIIFFAGSAFYFFKLSNDTFPKENWLAIAAALLFVLDKWVNLISVSGMETTLYLMLLIACYYYYRKRNAGAFGLTLALTFWARPDAVAFIAALAVDYIILLQIKKKSPGENEEISLLSKQDFIKIAAIAGGVIAVYFAMNMIISGSLLPNTYGAKLRYYSPEFRSRTDFMKIEVWEYFTDSAYILLIVPFFAAILKIILDTYNLKYNKNTLAVIFIFGLIFMYWYKLPYAHRFGRYLIPVIPFYILLFVYGSRELFRWLSKVISDKNIINGLNILLLVSAIIYASYAYYEHKGMYQDQTRHIYIRQVVAAKWLNSNTPEGSVIATHDVGAIAYYSNKKIVDVVGLINPEFIPKLNTKEFVDFAQEQMKKNNVTHTAFLKEWFVVANQTPLFEAGDKNEEIMVIQKYTPGKTHILSNEVNFGLMYVNDMIRGKQYQQAAAVLNKLAQLDQNSSLTYYLLAYTYSMLGDAKSSEKHLVKALELYPAYSEAVLALGGIYKTQNRVDDSRNLYSNYLKINPGDTTISKLYNVIKDTLKENKQQGK